MDWKSSCLHVTATLKDAIAAIDKSDAKIALIVDDAHRLIGTITDGDVRRGLLSGASLESPLVGVMNESPRVAYVTEQNDSLFAKMQRERVRHLPIVDDRGVLIGIETIAHLLNRAKRPNLVVLMVGGEGRRLRPLTDAMPKPMLQVGTRPILETIIERFRFFGFENFVFSVNFKAEKIEEHFGDGSAYSVNIRYVREQSALDTAGALSLLTEAPTEPFFVMNGDLLTNANFNDILNFHTEHPAMATMCVRNYDIQVPYGVVKADGHRLTAIEEKPVIRHFTNAGIYVFEPDVTKYMDENRPLSMPQLFERIMSDGSKCNVCPIREYWLDIGQKEDFERANVEYSSVFEEV